MSAGGALWSRAFVSTLPAIPLLARSSSREFFQGSLSVSEDGDGGWGGRGGSGWTSKRGRGWGRKFSRSQNKKLMRNGEGARLSVFLARLFRRASKKSRKNLVVSKLTAVFNQPRSPFSRVFFFFLLLPPSFRGRSFVIFYDSTAQGGNFPPVDWTVDRSIDLQVFGESLQRVVSLYS